MNKQGEDFVAQISKECENNVVYFDEFAAEIWNWYVDFGQWMRKWKVKEVRSLRANQSNPIPCESTKIIFFISTFTFDYEPVIEAIVSNSKYTEVDIYCGMSDFSHQAAQNSEGYFDTLRIRLSLLVEPEPTQIPPIFGVVHVPWLSNLWFYPLKEDINYFLGCGFTRPLSLLSLIATSDKTVSEVAYGIADFLCHTVGIKSADIYTISPSVTSYARKLQTAIQSYANPSSSPYGSSGTSVLMLDRCSDLISLMSHGDNLMDRMYKFKDNLSFDLKSPKYQNAILTSNSPIPHPMSESRCVVKEVFGGPFVHSLYMQTMLKKDKEVLTILAKEISNRIPWWMKTISEKTSGTSLYAKLAQIVDSIVENSNSVIPKKVHFTENIRWSEDFPYVQFAQNIISSQVNAVDMNCRQSSLLAQHWDQIQGIEKVMLLSAAQDKGDEEDQLLDRVLEIVKEQKEKLSMNSLKNPPMSFKQLQELMIFAYSLMSPESFDVYSWKPNQKESALIKMLVEFHFMEQQSFPVKDYVEWNKTIVTQWIQELNWIRSCRSTYQDFKEVLKSPNKSMGGVYKPLIVQVANAMFSQNDSSDFQRVAELNSANLSNILMSGFSRFGFGNQKKPRPQENKLIVICVLGGISCQELKELRDCAQKQKTYQFLLVSNGFTTSSQVLEVLELKAMHAN